MILSRSRRYSRELYLPWLQDLVDNGDTVDVRGRKTQEFINCVSEVGEPWHHCILLPSRRWNPWLALSEALWILAGRDDVAVLKPYNSHITDYSDDGITLYGAYGARMYHQIDDVIERLKKDPSDRRAILQIWDNTPVRYVDEYPSDLHADLTTNSKDPPCNDMVMFKLRNNKLHMTVINRSNDIHYGLFAVNLPTFGILQVYMAARLGVEVGTQTHFSNSLHVYTDDRRAIEITDRMLYQKSENLPYYPVHEKVFTNFFPDMTHANMAEMCSAVLDVEKISGSSPFFLHYAASFLRAYRERDLELILPYAEFVDWTLAAHMFANQVWHE